jgi:hypothetical protein
LAKTGKSVAKQLKTALGKLGKADSDDESDGIVTDLDLGLLAGLSAIHPWLEDVAADRAGDELLSLGISGETDFFSHANERAAAYAKQRAAELVTDIDDSTRDMLRSVIADGLEAGAMREDIIADIIALDIFSDDRATLIADTEVAMANGQGALAGYKEAKAAGVKLKKIWVCDSDPCPICEENQDAGEIDVEDQFPSGDDSEIAHPNCFIAGTSVAAVGVTVAFRRAFKGKIRIIGLAGNRDMSVTRNHPILTDRGWAKAIDLKVGDKLAKVASPEVLRLIADPKNHYIESSIKNVANSLLMSGGMATGTVPTTAIDFHGDGVVNGEVEIVRAASHLTFDVPAVAKKAINDTLGSGHIIESEVSFPRLSLSDSVSDRAASPSDGRMSGGGIGLSLLRSETGVLDELGGTALSNVPPGISEVLPDCGGLASDDPRYIYARLSGFIEFVEISQIRDEDFSGHVYNLSTVSQWYLAENIVVHNCECHTESVVENEKDTDDDEE